MALEPTASAHAMADQPGATPQETASPLLDAVSRLREAIAQTPLRVELPEIDAARREQHSLLQQLDDYILPRLKSLDAPLLCVVGGSTGAGKSTLVNSLVGEVVSRSGVLRPTTRASVLVHHPGDERWFVGDRVLPELARLTGAHLEHDDPGAVRLVARTALPQGLALLDAPDIDSVVATNRALSRQLLSAADLWLFVTTAARYADAVPWELLRHASERGTSVAVVLDRVPTDAVEEIRTHLAVMLREQQLGSAPVFTISEATLGADGRLPDAEVERIRSWLSSLAADASARAEVIRRTLTGALSALSPRTQSLGRAYGEQLSAIEALDAAAQAAYTSAMSGVEQGVQDGSLLRGEVLARWQELVGTGEFLRSVEVGVGRIRDRVTHWIQGKPMPTEDLGEALQSGTAALVLAQAQNAHLATLRRWRALPGGAPLLAANPHLADASGDLTERTERLIRDWQQQVFDLVRDEAGHRRTTARFLAFGVNGIGVMLMVIVFATTSGLTGAEVGIAGGTGVLAQRILEAVFGDQAVRELSRKARELLLHAVDALMMTERDRFLDATEALDVDPSLMARLNAAAAKVEEER